MTVTVCEHRTVRHQDVAAFPYICVDCGVQCCSQPVGSTILSADPRIDYLRALLAEGAEAIAQALHKGAVRVHIPKAKASTAPRPAGTGPAPRTKLNLDIARTVRARLAAGEKPPAIAADLKVHYTTIADIRDDKIWKEPTQA